MKRILSTLLAFLLLLSAAPGALATTLTEEEVGELVIALHEQHYTYHGFDMRESGDPPTLFLSSLSEPASILNCVESITAEAQPLPENSRVLKAMLGDAFGSAYAITEIFPEAQAMDLNKFNSVYHGDVALGLMTDDWYATGYVDDTQVFVGPLFLADSKRNTIDDALYVFAIICDPQFTTTWICADEAIVYEMLFALGIKDVKAINAQGRFVHDWLSARDDYYAALVRDLFLLNAGTSPDYYVPDEEEFEIGAGYRRKDIIGTVTITNDTRTNIREKDTSESSIVTSAMPGDTFYCVGVGESGWYLIVSNNDAGYVSPRLSSFTERED